MTTNILNGEKSARSDEEEIDDDSSNGNTSSDSGEFNSFFVIKTIYTNLIKLLNFFIDMFLHSNPIYNVIKTIHTNLFMPIIIF